MAQIGGNFFSTIHNLGFRLIPAITNFVSKSIPGLTNGVLNNLGTFGMDKILGNGLKNRPS